MVYSFLPTSRGTKTKLFTAENVVAVKSYGKSSFCPWRIFLQTSLKHKITIVVLPLLKVHHSQIM